MDKLELLLRLSYNATRSQGMLLSQEELEQMGLPYDSIELGHIFLLLDIMNIAVCQKEDNRLTIKLTNNGVRFCENDSFSNPGISLLDRFHRC